MKATRRGLRVRTAPRPRLEAGGSLISFIDGARRWLWLLAIPLLAALLAFVLIPNGDDDTDQALAGYVLVGDRAPACLRIVVMRDQSGSMVGFEGARDDAMTQLVTWSSQPQTLRADDELAIIDFAGDGQVALPTAPIATVGPVIPGNAVLDGEGTDFSDAVLAMRELPSTSCATALIVLSDGLIEPLTAAARSELSAQGVGSISLILPSEGSPPGEWMTDLGYSEVLSAPAGDPDRTAHAVGEAVATAVGQRLQRV